MPVRPHPFERSLLAIRSLAVLTRFLPLSPLHASAPPCFQEVLGDLPQKTFTDVSVPINTSPLAVPPTPAGTWTGGGNPAAMAALDRVLRLLQVGSKRFLTNKVSVLDLVYHPEDGAR